MVRDNKYFLWIHMKKSVMSNGHLIWFILKHFSQFYNKSVREIFMISCLRFPIDISFMTWLLQYCHLWRTLMLKLLCFVCSDNMKYDSWYILGVWNRWFVSSSVMNSSLFCAGCSHRPSNSLSTDPMLYRLAGFVNSSWRETSGRVRFVIQQLCVSCLPKFWCFIPIKLTLLLIMSNFTAHQDDYYTGMIQKVRSLTWNLITMQVTSW